MVFVERMPHPVVNTMLDAAYPRGALNDWRSSFMRDFDDDLTDLIVERLSRAPSPARRDVVEVVLGRPPAETDVAQVDMRMSPAVPPGSRHVVQPQECGPCWGVIAGSACDPVGTPRLQGPGRVYDRRHVRIVAAARRDVRAAGAEPRRRRAAASDRPDRLA